jgi:hypothetical protein
MPDRTVDEHILKAIPASGVSIPINIFQLMARLGQYYIVDQVSRAIDYRANWHKNNESTVFGGQSREILEDICGEEDTDECDAERLYHSMDIINNSDTSNTIVDATSDNSNNTINITSNGNDHYTYRVKSTPCFLSQSFHQSRRHLQKLVTMH